MKEQIVSLYTQNPKEYSPEDRALFDAFIEALNQGKIRACEPRDGLWFTNVWVKQGILLGFRMGKLAALPHSSFKDYYDKDTLAEKRFSLKIKCASFLVALLPETDATSQPM